MKIILIPNNQTMAARHYCIAKELQAQGHEVTYFMWQHPFGVSLKDMVKHLFTSLIPKTYRHESFTVHKAVRLPFFWPIINGWIFKAQLRRLYKELGADLILTEGYTNETEVPKDLPYVYDLADDYAGPAEVYGSAVYKLAFKLLNVRGVMRRQSTNALAVTAASSTLFDYAKTLNDNSTLVPNGVEKDLIEHTLSNKRRVARHSIVYATGFGPWSRAIETLETVTALRKEFPDIKLTLVGSGSEVPKIKQYIEENDASSYITYLDYVYDRQELFSLLSHHAIGLNISDKNAWRDASHPMKVMDYSALGMKVVSTNLTEVKKLDYNNIYLFSDTNKRQGFKSVLRKALRDTKRSYKKVMNTVVTDYNWQSLVQSLTAVSEHALGQRALKNEVDNERIIHVSYAYPPAIGGLEQVAYQLATAQAEAGLPVSVITSDKGWDRRKKLSDAIPVARLRSFVVANTTIMPGLFGKLMKLRSTDTVHLHIAQAFTPEMVWIASKIKGFKYVAHVHLDVPPSGWAGFLLRIYKPVVLAKVLRDAHAVAVFTADQKKTLSTRYGVASANVHVIPNGVANDYFMAPRRTMHKKPRLLFVGRLSYQKNLTQLLDALDGISDQFETTIVGDGELKRELKAQARRLRLKNLTFAGFAQGKKLRSFYEQADIFVLPSEREGMPLVLLEAMAAGLPIVATRVTGNKDVVKHRKNGLLVPYGNANALCTALTKLAADKSLYRSMSRTTSEMAQAFTWTEVKEKFSKAYPTNAITPSESAVKTDGHTYALPAIIIPLLVAAVAAYALPNILGSVITLLFFLTVPGNLVLRKVAKDFGGWWERAGLSVVLSLLVIMGGGLLLNLTHYVGVSRPLTTLNIFIMLSLATLSLVWLNRKVRISLRVPRVSYPSITYLVVSVLLTLLPVLAIGGAIRLNNGASNVLTMVMFALIAFLALLLISKRDLRPLFPYALFTIALSILLSTSLRGWSITGHDIRHEFQVFQSTYGRAFWMARVPSYDPYNSCLSISILPTILYNIAHIPAVYIYKAVFQVIFAFGIVPMYYLFSKFLKKRSAFLAGFVVITFPVFMNDLTFLNRQEIAFMFFLALLITTFSNITARSKYILTILLLIGILFSHYSTNYVTVGLLVGAFVIYKIFTYRAKLQKDIAIPLLSIPIILFAMIITYTWGAVITQTSPNIERTFTRAMNAIKNGDAIHSTTTRFSLFGSEQQSREEILSDYADEEKNEITYVAQDILPLTSVGETINNTIDVRAANELIHSSIAKLYQVLVILGVSILFIRMVVKKRKQELSVRNTYLTAISAGSIMLLVLLTVLPYVSVSYDVGRMFMQTLFITSVPVVVAGEFIFHKTRKATYVTAGLIIIVFLFISGCIPQITGGYDPKINLANSGTYYNFFYEHSTDKAGSAWLAANRNKDLKVFLDTDASTKLPFYVSAGLLHQDTKLGYVYESYRNVTANAYRVFPNGELLEYSDSRVRSERNLLYANQGSAVYSPTVNQ